MIIFLLRKPAYMLFCQRFGGAVGKMIKNDKDFFRFLALL